MAGEAPDLTTVMAQLEKQQQDAEQQRVEFKIVLAQLVEKNTNKKQRDEGSLTLQSTTDSVNRADFNRVLDELTRDREEDRKDSRDQLKQAHRRELENKEREKEILEVSLKRELEREMMIRDESRQRDVDNKEREKIIREEAREQRQEMANLYQMMLQAQQNGNQTQLQTQIQPQTQIQMPVQTNIRSHRVILLWSISNHLKNKYRRQQQLFTVPKFPLSDRLAILPLNLNLNLNPSQ
ncbi:hypothetical protein ScalyP_jg11250 [Parmales sp. scaly parma]|nr:hypothetical protein ScalyP_jg11250 [Parmales sp. scaly parma]